MDKDIIKENLDVVNDILKIVRDTNDKTVKMLYNLRIIDLNLKINSASLADATDRIVVSEFSNQIGREIEIMQKQMNDMLKHRQMLKDAIGVIENEIEK